MKITKIKIENFKSIKEIEFDVKKYGNSYTTMLVGINESGKSNVLEAMSYLATPEDEFDYNTIHCQKDEATDPIDLWFFLEFEKKQTYLDEVRSGVENGDLLDFEIENLVKNVYLQSGDTSFSDDFSFDVKKLSKGLFVKEIQKVVTNTKGQTITVKSITLSKTNDEEESFEELTSESFEEYFSGKIKDTARKYEPIVSYWSPSEEYLVSEVDLNTFKDDVNSNIPLKHIFYIAGFDDPEKVESEINKISNISLRRKLAGTLGKKATEYVKNIWKHDIIVDIEIAESGSCVVSIRDGGKDNEFNYHKMTARSEGFKQFMSLILSLSIETKTSKRVNNLILIDEPEAHLHPSGIRDLRNELLSIGENNYLFVSTHSPFLVDRVNKERNVIIKKNKSASTQKIEIDQNTDIIDDEVLREAFGIEVYKDLLNPHSILVEGSSDKKIIQKALITKDLKGYGITNGHGSNIDTLASKLNDSNLSLLVILDDDSDGKEYKEKILKIGGSFSDTNVFTIRDLVGGVVEGGTIEDVLDTGFVESKLREVFAQDFPGDQYDLTFDVTQPFVKQVKIQLQQKRKTNQEIDGLLENLKIIISDDVTFTKTSLQNNFPLLDSLVGEINKKLK